MPDRNAAARTRVVSWTDARLVAEAARTMAGIDFLRAMLAGQVSKPPIAETLGFDLARVEPGVAVFTCTPGEEHYNPIGVVHGGLVSTLIDSATGCAVHTTLPEGVGYTTISLSVHLLRPLTDESGPVRCVGQVVHRGGRVAIAEGEVVGDRDGKVYARGRTVCLILQP